MTPLAGFGGIRPAGGVASCLSALMLRLLRRTDRRVGVVLLYHAVASRQGDPERELLPPLAGSAFARQLDHLVRNYEVVPLEGFLRAVGDRRRGQGFPVCVTFDDDLCEHLATAAPLLRSRRVPATFFLTGGALQDPGHEFWWQLLQRAVDSGMPLSRLAGMLPAAAADGHAAPLHVYGVAATIRSLPGPQRDELTQRLATVVAPSESRPNMSREDVRALAQTERVGIGFHTLRHDYLPALDDAALDRAMTDGREALEAVTGERLVAIAYPHGGANPRVVGAARRAGFEIGVTTRARPVMPTTDPLLLGRYEPRTPRVGVFAAGMVRQLLGGRGDPASTWGRRLVRNVVSIDDRRRLRSLYARMTAWPPVGSIRFGSLRRTTPFSRRFGFDRGTPVDRYYIERFLATSAAQAPNPVRGVILEIGDDVYARHFGDPAAIERVEILDVSPANAQATVVADLSDAAHLPDDGFDCVICTQTLLLIYDVHAAVRTLHRILRPGGTLLATVPGISQIPRAEMDAVGDYWRFTTASARRLFEEVFQPASVTVESYGNVLAATAFLYGLAAEDLRPHELEVRDRDYQLLIGIRAIKSESPSTPDRPAP